VVCAWCDLLNFWFGFFCESLKITAQGYAGLADGVKLRVHPRSSAFIPIKTHVKEGQRNHGARYTNDDSVNDKCNESAPD
jgi:hypothetical protein